MCCFWTVHTSTEGRHNWREWFVGLETGKRRPYWLRQPWDAWVSDKEGTWEVRIERRLVLRDWRRWLKKFALPSLVTSTKEQNGHGLSVPIIFVLQRAQKNQLRLFTITENHCTDSNQILEDLHRTINDISSTSFLPRKLFVQLDNYSRGIKKRFFMSYAGSLVYWGVFK